MPSHLPSRSSVAVGRVPKAAPRAAPDLYLFPLRLSPATWLGWRKSTYAIRDPTVTAASEQRLRNAWNPAAAEFDSCAPPRGPHALFARHISRFPLPLTRAWRTSDAQTTNCVLCVSSLKANSTPSRRPQPPATLVSSPLIFELRQHTSSPSCCSRPRPRPSNTAAVTAMPLLRLVLLLTRAFLRGARQEGPLVPPTLPWQVELSEGPPPAPPLLRRRPHNKTHFPLHRLS